MIEIISHVVWPGWLTRIFQDQQTGETNLFHQCITCGARLDGATVLKSRQNLLVEHVRIKHPAEAINAEIYALRAAIHVLNIRYGLKLYEWPN